MNEAEMVCRFGLPGPMRDRLVVAVLRGEKTATASLLAEPEAENEPLPAVGDRLTVIDSDEKPVAVIELVAVDIIRLGDADLRLARQEGEGFDTVSEWREAHERFWREQELPGLSKSLTDDTRIVVERFRLVDSG
jgi:uncharacterized protein YhfF